MSRKNLMRWFVKHANKKISKKTLDLLIKTGWLSQEEGRELSKNNIK